MSKASRERIIRGSRRSPRVVHFATKVTPEFDAVIRQSAHQEGITLAEMLEHYQLAYEKKVRGKTERTKGKKPPKSKKEVEEE